MSGVKAMNKAQTIITLSGSITGARYKIYPAAGKYEAEYADKQSGGSMGGQLERLGVVLVCLVCSVAYQLGLFRLFGEK